MLGKVPTKVIEGKGSQRDEMFGIIFIKPKTKFCLNFHINGDKNLIYFNTK